MGKVLLLGTSDCQNHAVEEKKWFLKNSILCKFTEVD